MLPRSQFHSIESKIVVVQPRTSRLIHFNHRYWWRLLVNEPWPTCQTQFGTLTIPTTAQLIPLHPASRSPVDWLNLFVISFGGSSTNHNHSVSWDPADHVEELLFSGPRMNQSSEFIQDALQSRTGESVNVVNKKLQKSEGIGTKVSPVHPKFGTFFAHNFGQRSSNWVIAAWIKL